MRALGIAAAYFFEEREKDRAESPTPAFGARVTPFEQLRDLPTDIISALLDLYGLYRGLIGYLCSSSLFMGPTGFDSKEVGVVSMSGVGKIIRDQIFQILLGESNFALAA